MLLFGMQQLKDHLLETLSFFECMSLEKIILDLDEKIVKEFPEFTKDKLEALLRELEQDRIIKSYRLEKDLCWKKIDKTRRTWSQRIRAFLRRGKL